MKERKLRNLHCMINQPPSLFPLSDWKFRWPWKCNFRSHKRRGSSATDIAGSVTVTDGICRQHRLRTAKPFFCWPNNGTPPFEGDYESPDIRGARGTISPPWSFGFAILSEIRHLLNGIKSRNYPDICHIYDNIEVSGCFMNVLTTVAELNFTTCTRELSSQITL